MKTLPHLSSLLYCTPWCIIPSAHADLSNLYQRYLKGELPETAATPMTPNNLHGAKRHTYGIAHHVSEDGKIAIIYCEGIVAKKAPDMMCGPTTIDLLVLDRLLKDVAADAGIQTLILYMDTPGGCGIGLAETSSCIQQVRDSGKRVVCYADYLLASAGYWIASSCDAIYTAPSTMVGCIGTYVAAIDDSEAWKQEGLKLKLFRDGEYKAMGHPGKEWTPEEEALMEAKKDAWGKEFKDHVRTNRPGIEDGTMQGQTFDGSTAPTALIDGTYRDLEDCIASEMSLLTS